MNTRTPTRRFEARRAAIVASAIEVMNRKGVRGMTLGEVAARLDLVPTGVIYYFRNKEALAQACYLNGVERFNALIAQGEAGTDVAERLTLFLDAYFAFRRQVAEHRAEDVVLFNDVRALNDATVNAAYVELFRAIRSLLVAPGAEARSRNALNARAHMLLAEVLWSIVWLPRRDPEDYGWVARRFGSMVCDGLAAPGARWDPVPLTDLMAARREDSAELFLCAATELINEQGYVGASVEKISARLNVTKGAFYHHNAAKDDLVQACFERTLEVMRLAVRQAEAVTTSGYQALASIAASLVEYQVSGNAPLLRTSALTLAPEAIQGRLIAQFDRLSERFASMICDGVADGSLRPVDVNIAAQMFTGMINAAAELRAWTRDLTPAEAVELYVQPFFEGLAGA
ncbi:TetR/AcrR family transcriptional regulator [Phenylobacterium aquaticum]|uniref:TetR/AcrR family transcriptional regulator n=1 Tax=Phenylobacterium aquaticum TaxID=1763816 RepID=UPI0026EAA245|nr:TetR/AcrR family transcriptional regulator [Phenylobacterium aquaticum]